MIDPKEYEHGDEDVQPEDEPQTTETNGQTIEDSLYLLDKNESKIKIRFRRSR